MTTQEIKTMITKVRVYSPNPTQEWKVETDETRCGQKVLRCVQSEYAYTDYDLNGNIKGIGSEDFSRDRLHTDMITGYVYGWNGRRNKGGYKWWDCIGFYQIRKTDRQAFLTMMKNTRDAYMEFQFRRIR